MVQATDDSFRALARSAPWRWSWVRITRRDAHGVVTLDLRQADVVEGASRGSGPCGLECLDPPRRPDGLVSDRPRLMLEWDEIGGRDYTWRAMLDPHELSTGVSLSDVRPGERAGRETWWARAVPHDGYDPRCGCCPLLWSHVSDTLEHECGGPPPRPLADYPTAYDVALDVETGIVVSVAPVGGVRDDLGFGVRIQAAETY